nr:immunoglobulin heavy chain junction region [Mus musculus]
CARANWDPMDYW